MQLSFPILRSDDGYRRDLDHDLRNGKRCRGEQCAGREFLSVDFLANIGEALRVASVRNRDGHPDYVLECAAGALEGLLEILEGLASLSVEVPGERSSAIVDEPDMASQPHRLPALRDDRGREGVFRFPRGSMIVFLSAISISVADLRSSDSRNYVFGAADALRCQRDDRIGVNFCCRA